MERNVAHGQTRQRAPSWRDYEVDDEGRNVHLTEAGAAAVEAALGGIDLYAGPHLAMLTRVNVALYAQALLRRDVDYIVRDGRIELVSASRGRVSHLQRWPDGLHAAVEAKEGRPRQPERRDPRQPHGAVPGRPLRRPCAA